MYKNENKKPKGFIAIVSLLIISAVALTFAMLMLKDGVENASLSLHSIYYDDARINVNACLEDVLLRIKKEEQFSRNLNYAISSHDSCSTTMEWFDPQQINPFIIERLVEVQITGTSHNFTRTFNYGLKVAQHKLYQADGSLQYLNNINVISIDEITT